ncbi:MULTISPECIES: putative ABC transporter permease [unclassified Butyrivibrio]|uniref:putative ABC transporter permease n=1 Tax=unclassified Butyrivibrio TaxID=2639466 RepID=UPI0003B67F86|nr:MULTISPECIES: putative ABC transporter permease [unclassified Butyrivibrio]SEL70362.1 Uncharacterized membrane protein [Butyrivibrio sp. ob235]
MIIAKYFVEFLFYSFLGWVWESIYCTAKEKKWADRGFLFGPVCPIYGSCVVVTSVVFSYFKVLSSPDFPIWGIFIICMLGSAVAEFATSWVLEKRFHARWWDYSTMPLNIQGRICVPVSIAFGIAGVLIVKFLIPVVEGLHSVANPHIYEVLAIVLAMVFGADFALTEASLSALLKDVERMHEEFNIRAQTNYEKMASASKAIEQRITEERAAAELRVEALSKAYVEQLSLNQRRILLGIESFTSRKNEELANLKLKNKFAQDLKNKVRERRSKK